MSLVDHRIIVLTASHCFYKLQKFVDVSNDAIVDANRQPLCGGGQCYWPLCGHY